MDSLAVAAIISAVGAILISIYTHIRHSKCCFGIEIDNFPPNEIQYTTPQTTPHTTPHTTPETTHIESKV